MIITKTNHEQFYTEGFDTGHRHQKAGCWKNTDAHFACLEQFNDKYPNHDKCPETKKDWFSTCDSNVRKYQLLKRQMDADNKLLYQNQKRLDEHNVRHQDPASMWFTFAPSTGT